jgi:hypothetical protein
VKIWKRVRQNIIFNVQTLQDPGTEYMWQEKQEDSSNSWNAFPGKHRVTDINAQADIERKTWCFSYFLPL